MESTQSERLNASKLASLETLAFCLAQAKIAHKLLSDFNLIEKHLAQLKSPSKLCFYLPKEATSEPKELELLKKLVERARDLKHQVTIVNLLDREQIASALGKSQAQKVQILLLKDAKWLPEIIVALDKYQEAQAQLSCLGKLGAQTSFKEIRQKYLAKVQQLLGMARRARALKLGLTAVSMSLKKGDTALLFVAQDLAEGSKAQVKTFLERWQVANNYQKLRHQHPKQLKTLVDKRQKNAKQDHPLLAREIQLGTSFKAASYEQAQLWICTCFTKEELVGKLDTGQRALVAIAKHPLAKALWQTLEAYYSELANIKDPAEAQIVEHELANLKQTLAWFKPPKQASRFKKLQLSQHQTSKQAVRQPKFRVKAKRRDS